MGKTCVVWSVTGGVDPRSFEAYIPHNLLSARGDAELPCFNPADYKALGEATWHAAAWQSILKPVGEYCVICGLGGDMGAPLNLISVY